MKKKEFNYARNLELERVSFLELRGFAGGVPDASTPSWPLSTDTTSWSSDPLASWTIRL